LGLTRVRQVLRVASRAVAGLLAATVTLIGTWYVPTSALFFGRTHYRVLSPASPGGCRLVGEVTRDSYSAGSAGRIYLALPRSTMVQETGSGWNLPGSIDPFRDRAWSLRWEGKVGYLTVNGADYDSLPADDSYGPPTGTFTCPR